VDGRETKDCFRNDGVLVEGREGRRQHTIS
jgi:hypothetical protein